MFEYIYVKEKSKLCRNCVLCKDSNNIIKTIAEFDSLVVLQDSNNNCIRKIKTSAIFYRIGIVLTVISIIPILIYLCFF